MKAKKKFNERKFDYSLFTTEALRIFTDALHGKPPKKMNIYYQTNRSELEINYMQLIAFLSFDGQLSWKIVGFQELLISNVFIVHDRMKSHLRIQKPRNGRNHESIFRIRIRIYEICSILVD